MKQLDKYTYGGTKASEVLAILLKDNPKLIRRVGNVLSDFSTTGKEIVKSDIKAKEHILGLWYADCSLYLKHLDMDEKTQSYASNVLQTLRKKLIRSISIRGK
jgi:hypothetical protein